MPAFSNPLSFPQVYTPGGQYGEGAYNAPQGVPQLSALDTIRAMSNNPLIGDPFSGPMSVVNPNPLTQSPAARVLPYGTHADTLNKMHGWPVDQPNKKPNSAQNRTTMDLILERLNQRSQQVPAGGQPRYVSQQPTGSSGGFYYNGFLRPSNWSVPSEEELQNPNWEQARDMKVRADNAERYGREMPLEKMQALAARSNQLRAIEEQRYRDSGASIRALGFNTAYNDKVFDEPNSEIPLGPRERGMMQADEIDRDAENLASTVRGLIGARPGQPRFADRLDVAGTPRGESLADLYSNIMHDVKGLREQSGRVRSAASNIPQTVTIPTPGRRNRTR